MALSNEDLAKAKAKRDKAGAACGKKMKVAADALTAFLKASNKCYDGTGVTELDDYRVQLRDEIQEFAYHLDRTFNKEKESNDEVSAKENS